MEGEGRKEIREVGRREGGRQVEGPVKMENQDFIWTPPQCSCCTFGWGKAGASSCICTPPQCSSLLTFVWCKLASLGWCKQLAKLHS